MFRKLNLNTSYTYWKIFSNLRFCFLSFRRFGNSKKCQRTQNNSETDLSSRLYLFEFPNVRKPFRFPINIFETGKVFSVLGTISIHLKASIIFTSFSILEYCRCKILCIWNQFESSTSMGLYDKLRAIHVLVRYFSIIINYVSQERSYQVCFEITLNIWQYFFRKARICRTWY
jgi:hypothetical protein